MKSYILPGILLLSVAACSPHRARYTAGSYSEVNSGLSQDSSTLNHMKFWMDSVNNSMNEVFAFTDTVWLAALPGSNLGNFIADAVKNEADSFLLMKKGFNSSFCFLNRGSIRNALPKGDITARALFEMLPFENELVLVKLSGNITDSVMLRISNLGGGLVSGLEMEIGSNEYRNARIAGSRLDSRRDYWMATSDYIVNGGEGFSMLDRSQQVLRTGIKIRDLVKKLMKSESKMYGKLLHHEGIRISKFSKQ